MKGTLLQAALKMRKRKVLLPKIDLLKSLLGKRKKNRKKKWSLKTILEKRQNSEAKLNDQIDNYGRYIPCHFRGMPEKGRGYLQFKIQEFIYQVKI